MAGAPYNEELTLLWTQAGLASPRRHGRHRRHMEAREVTLPLMSPRTSLAMGRTSLASSTMEPLWARPRDTRDPVMLLVRDRPPPPCNPL